MQPPITKTFTGRSKNRPENDLETSSEQSSFRDSMRTDLFQPTFVQIIVRTQATTRRPSSRDQRCPLLWTKEYLNGAYLHGRGIPAEGARKKTTVATLIDQMVTILVVYFFIPLAITPKSLSSRFSFVHGRHGGLLNYCSYSHCDVTLISLFGRSSLEKIIILRARCRHLLARSLFS